MKAVMKARLEKLRGQPENSEVKMEAYAEMMDTNQERLETYQEKIEVVAEHYNRALRVKALHTRAPEVLYEYIRGEYRGT
jgi:methyltransferase-like protein